MKQGFENSSLSQEVLSFHCPRWAELPGIALYMDQVTGYINEIFAPIAPQEQQITLTKAMVNNYVKQRVMSPPVNKKYDRAHMAYLVTICALKQVFSIPEIGSMIRAQMDHCPVEQAYDCFCEELESALQAVFLGQAAPTQIRNEQDPAAITLLRGAVQAYASKVYVQKRLAFAEQTAQQE